MKIKKAQGRKRFIYLCVLLYMHDFFSSLLFSFVCLYLLSLSCLFLFLFLFFFLPSFLLSFVWRGWGWGWEWGWGWGMGIGSEIKENRREKIRYDGPTALAIAMVCEKRISVSMNRTRDEGSTERGIVVVMPLRKEEFPLAPSLHTLIPWGRRFPPLHPCSFFFLIYSIYSW